MSDLSVLFQRTTRAQACLSGMAVGWPAGVAAFDGLSSCSAQAYARIWALQGALASAVVAGLSEVAERRWFKPPLPVQQWRRCATELLAALDLALVHARARGHSIVLASLSTSRPALAGLATQLETLENRAGV